MEKGVRGLFQDYRRLMKHTIKIQSKY